MIGRIAATIALTLTPSALAQIYIVPSGDCGAITLRATRGTEFPNLGEAIEAERVTEAYLYLPKRRDAVKGAGGSRSLDFVANAPANELLMAAVSFAPMVSGHETRIEHAKAFVYCGEIDPYDSWQRAAGLGVEIIPQWNGRLPLKPCDPIRFIALHKATGKVLRDAPIELYRAGAGRVAPELQDQAKLCIGADCAGGPGSISFQYPGPGRYLVTATYRRRNPEKPELWLVDTSTLTFEFK